MSINRSTVPARLYKPKWPSADSVAVTAFGVGACPATQSKLDANGRAASAGNTVKYDPDDGFMIVALSDTPVAPDGIVQ